MRSAIAVLAADAVALAFYDEYAREQTSASYFGDQYEKAVALRAMHNYSIDQSRSDGEAGLVTGKSEGNASIRYWNKVNEGRYSDLQMTHFGQRLLALIKATGPAVSVAGDPNNLIAQITSASS